MFRAEQPALLRRSRRRRPACGPVGGAALNSRASSSMPGDAQRVVVGAGAERLAVAPTCRKRPNARRTAPSRSGSACPGSAPSTFALCSRSTLTRQVGVELHAHVDRAEIGLPRLHPQRRQVEPGALEQRVGGVVLDPALQRDPRIVRRRGRCRNSRPGWRWRSTTDSPRRRCRGRSAPRSRRAAPLPRTCRSSGRNRSSAARRTCPPRRRSASPRNRDR